MMIVAFARVDQFMAAGGVHIECRISARGEVQDVKVRTGRSNRMVIRFCPNAPAYDPIASFTMVSRAWFAAFPVVAAAPTPTAAMHTARNPILIMFIEAAAAAAGKAHRPSPAAHLMRAV